MGLWECMSSKDPNIELELHGVGDRDGAKTATWGLVDSEVDTPYFSSIKSV